MDATDTALPIALVHARGVCAPESSSLHSYRLKLKEKWLSLLIDVSYSMFTQRRSGSHY